MTDTRSRRRFLRDASLGTAGVVIGSAHAASVNAARGQEGPHADQHRHEGDEETKPQRGRLSIVEGVDDFPRTEPGPGGPLGSSTDRGKLVPGRRAADLPPVEVETPDIPKLPYKLKDGVKEFHLTAEHVQMEILPDKFYDFWGYNGTMPGPTIEAVEGDRVRIVVHNKLPESTTVHWHGFELPIAMDGANDLTQPPIKPGGSFTYEFALHQNGTFFYHSHGAMQEAIGMVGLFVVHPREAWQPTCDRDIGFILQEFTFLPKATIPDTMNENFNFFTINGRAAPNVTPVVVRLGDRVRLRFMNLSTMDHHPMHMHGHTFWVTGTEGGRIPESAWIPGNTVLVSVGQSRDVEFIANNPGDWMLHCHIPHHMMNHMVPMVGPERIELTETDVRPRVGTEDETPGKGRPPRPAAAPTGGHQPEHEAPPAHAKGGYNVPGFPQDMMDMEMFDEFQIKAMNGPLTRGMMKNWHRGLMGMMTAIRVLPPDLYDQVTRGKGPIPPGASVGGLEHHNHPR